VGIFYAAFIHWGSSEGEHGFKRWQVYTLAAVLVVYVAVILIWVLNYF
jgi:cation:H+ antiporter